MFRLLFQYKKGARPISVVAEHASGCIQHWTSIVLTRFAAWALVVDTRYRACWLSSWQRIASCPLPVTVCDHMDQAFPLPDALLPLVESSNRAKNNERNDRLSDARSRHEAELVASRFIRAMI